MSADEPKPPSTLVAAPGAGNSKVGRAVLAFVLNVFALLWYGFAQIGPLLPSHGFPTPFVWLASVGVPSALILVAARLSKSRVARTLCYIEIVCILFLSSHLYWTLAHLIGEGYLV
jgi:hypothetical protein